MQRVTMTIDDSQLAVLDAYADRRGYPSRSEAMRDILHAVEVRDTAAGSDDTICIATLTYLYEHDSRELARRLTAEQHRHHHLSLSTLHVHVSHDDCLEVTVLKGPLGQIRQLADAMLTQRGVRMGNLHVMPLAPGDPQA